MIEKAPNEPPALRSCTRAIDNRPYEFVGCGSLAVFLGTAARRAHGSSALVHAMRDLIASHAPLRKRRHKARQAYTKPLTPGDSRGSQSPWHAFLPHLSSCNERWGHRRSSRKENVRKHVKQNPNPKLPKTTSQVIQFSPIRTKIFKQLSQKSSHSLQPLVHSPQTMV